MNTLTEETLKELERLHERCSNDGADYGDSPNDVAMLQALQDHLPALISSAREALRLREALEKIANLSWGYDGDCGAVAIADEALEKPGGSSNPLPASSAAPETDAPPPERDQECAHGVRFGRPCEECHQEVLLRKGLDDHSCNSTGWEKP
jgi:RNA polymerase-binding transcription factor DksA